MDAKTYWNKRSKEYKDNVEGVLFKPPYPSFVNNSFHTWSTKQVENALSRYNSKRVLDIGCGYGRMESELVDHFPKCVFDGIDLAEPYVSSYNNKIKQRGKAKMGDVRKIPFKAKSYDCVVMVATLMYLTTPKDQEKAFDEIDRILKAKGTLVLVERTPYMLLLDPKVLLKKGRYTNQIAYTSRKLQTLAKGLRLKDTDSWPSSVLPLFTSYVFRKEK